MPIRPPALDDRGYEDLVAELIERIPAHTPEWTHPRPGDPGRTLIELFAWLGDTLLYRANLIPERQRLAFLRLLGAPLKPARAATGMVCLDVSAAKEPAAVDVAPGAVIEKPVPFTTRQFATAFPVTGRAFYKRRLDSDEQRRFNELLPDLTVVYKLEGDTPEGYVTTEAFPEGAMNPDGVDMIADSVDGALWIALMAPSAKLREAARLSFDRGTDGSPRALNVGVALAYRIPDIGEDVGRRAQVPVLWEITTGASAAGLELLDLEVLQDSTAHFSRHGVVRLGLPALKFIGAPGNDVRDNPAAGLGESPPRLDSPEDAGRLIAWVRLRVKPDFPIASLRLSWAGLNAVEIEQRESLPPRALGVSDGGSDQVFDLGAAGKGSVEAASLVLDVRDPLAPGLVWGQVDDLGSAGPLDPVYRLDAEAGSVSFGDGVHGRVPSTGSQIVAFGLRVGGGRRGNLPAGSLAALDSILDMTTGQRKKPEAPIKLLQPLALTGGADAEDLAEAERRIPALIRHRDRVVTVEDYRLLARQSPGVDVGRVEVLPRFKPHERQGDIPGVVSVMVLPAKPTLDFTPPYPRADRPLLESVHAFLEVRRPLATELYVIGCAYRSLGLAAAVQVKAGFAREQVLLSVRMALRRYLWPLPLGIGGVAGDWPEGQQSDGGYPLGRTLTDRELEVVVARVAGVAGVAPVRLFEFRDGAYAELPGAGKQITRFELEPYELPELSALVVVEGVDAPASVESPFPRPAGAATVAVPIVPEVC